MEVMDEKVNGAQPMEVEEIVSVRDRELLYLFVVRTLLKVHYLSI